MNAQQPMPAEAIAALENGNKIEAIKIVRITYRLGLKEAKDLVEAHLESAPQLSERVRSVSSDRQRHALLRLALVLLIAAALYYYRSGTF